MMTTTTTVKMNEKHADYLKKMAREMPLGLCRDMLAALRARLENTEPRPEEATAKERVLHKGMIYNARNCLKELDRAICEGRADMPLGETPEYNEDDCAAVLALALGLEW